jgi:hypothetical protein
MEAECSSETPKILPYYITSETSDPALELFKTKEYPGRRTVAFEG